MAIEHNGMEKKGIQKHCSNMNFDILNIEINRFERCKKSISYLSSEAEILIGI
jgi:hypothetical protein